MNTAYLILGGNKGDKINNLNQALLLIEEKVGTIISKSKLYETAAWGNTNQPGFLNQVVYLETMLNPYDLLNSTIKIEESLGRVRGAEKWLERTIDIDILFYNNEVIDTPDLKIPHPYIQERMFVLIPLMDIAPTLIHPILKEDITMLINKCEDKLEVKSTLPFN
jgi:2-amino-4-hydroxy-6-hydroxymethyldihydropteridine diphosphokinase